MRTPPHSQPPRLDFPGAFYHLLARGDRRATIFHDDADLTHLEHDRRRNGWSLLSLWKSIRRLVGLIFFIGLALGGLPLREQIFHLCFVASQVL